MPSEDSRGESSTSPKPFPEKDAILEDVLDHYLQELAEGREPDQESYLRAYPALTDALRGLFKTLDFVETTTRTLNAGRLEEGQHLGEFRIIKEIGRGGMGVVYEAVQTSLDRRVALKVLAVGALLSDNALTRFTREATLAGSLHHTNIVPVYAVGSEQEIHYYAMQYIEGRSLSDLLKERAAADARPNSAHYKRIANWGRQAAEALAYAHGKGIRHRDIKPSNLLIDAADNLWIADFGLARADADATITHSGDVIGTARYMSPEQARGGKSVLDERTDIYSLGTTLYELLAQQPAFDGESRDQILDDIIRTEPVPLRRVQGSVPRDLETIVFKCMQKNPDHRYASAADLADDCRRVVAGESIRARRTPIMVKAARFLGRHRTATAGILIVAALIVVSYLLKMQLRHSQGEQLVDEAFAKILFERDFKPAAGLLDRAESLGVDSARLHLYRGLIPLFNNQPQQASGPLIRALQRDPANHEAQLALALAHINSGDVFRGQKALDRAGERPIDTALGWLLHGLAKSKNQRDEAIESFNRATGLRRDFTPAISARAYYRGFRLQTEGDRDQLDLMLNDCDALVVFQPNSAQSYTDWARGYLSAAAFGATQSDGLSANRRKWLANCRQDLDKALTLRRDDESLPYVQHGVYLRYVGDYGGARRAFGRAIDVDLAVLGSCDPALIHKHAMVAYALGDLQEALDEIEPFCESMPTFFPLSLQRALLLADLGRLDEARAACQDCIDRQIAFTNALFPAAAMMELLGDPDAAAAAIERFSNRGAGEVVTEAAAHRRFEPAFEYLSGRCDAQTLIDSAGGLPGPRCEYAFLIALRALGGGNREEGMSALNLCLKSEIFRFLEHRFAQIMLERFKAEPRWPTWIAARRNQ